MHQILFPASVRSFVRPFVFDTVDESQRRRHGVTAAIWCTLLVRWGVSLCPSVRSFVRLLDGVLHITRIKTPRNGEATYWHVSMRWLLTTQTPPLTHCSWPHLPRLRSVICDVTLSPSSAIDYTNSHWHRWLSTITQSLYSSFFIAFDTTYT